MDVTCYIHKNVTCQCGNFHGWHKKSLNKKKVNQIMNDVKFTLGL